MADPLKQSSVAIDPLAEAESLAQTFAHTAAERDQTGGTARQERALIRQSGLLNLSVPAECGGFGCSWPTIYQVVRRIARADGSLGHVLGYHFLELAVPHLLGSIEQRAHYYRQTVQNGWFWGNAFNPPAVSSLDPTEIAGWKVTIEPDGGRFRLDGTNFYCSGATDSDQLIVSALRPGEKRLRNAFVTGAIPTGRSGVLVNDDWDNLGQKQTDSGSVTFKQVVIHPEELFLAPGPFAGPFPTLRTCLAQLFLTNVYLGIAEGAFAEAIAFCRDKASPWINSGVAQATADPYLQRHAGELFVDLESARLLTDRAAASFQAAWDQGAVLTAEQRGLVAVEAAVAKTAATRAGLRLTSEMFEIMGARATRRRDGFDRFWRNLRTHTLHDPVDYKIRDLGRFALTDQLPAPGFYS